MVDDPVSAVGREHDLRDHSVAVVAIRRQLTAGLQRPKSLCDATTIVQREVASEVNDLVGIRVDAPQTDAVPHLVARAPRPIDAHPQRVGRPVDDRLAGLGVAARLCREDRANPLWLTVQPVAGHSLRHAGGVPRDGRVFEVHGLVREEQQRSGGLPEGMIRGERRLPLGAEHGRAALRVHRKQGFCWARSFATARLTKRPERESHRSERRHQAHEGGRIHPNPDVGHRAPGRGDGPLRGSTTHRREHGGQD